MDEEDTSYLPFEEKYADSDNYFRYFFHQDAHWIDLLKEITHWCWCEKKLICVEIVESFVDHHIDSYLDDFYDLRNSSNDDIAQMANYVWWMSYDYDLLTYTSYSDLFCNK